MCSDQVIGVERVSLGFARSPDKVTDAELDTWNRAIRGKASTLACSESIEL